MPEVEQHNLVNCVQKDAIAEMGKKINAIYELLCTESTEGRQSVLSRLRVAEGVIDTLQRMLDKYADHSTRLVSVEKDLNAHFARHDKAQARADKVRFWALTSVMGVLLAAIVTWIISGGLTR